MTSLRKLIVVTSATLTCALNMPAGMSAVAQDVPGVPATEGPTLAEGTDAQEPEVLTSGPVHEAFAEPLVPDLADGLIVKKSPPEPIDELPPDVAPEGGNVQWIPGYWGWDDEIDDFIWISGLWRNIPPGQRWVPGHWAEVEGGYRWVSGFWTGAEVTELEYLPNPPASLEQGPNIAAPGPDYFWIPGCWIYASAGYQWQAGYWAHGYDDWCWIPQQYTWTPRGCLYSAGYWDYRVPFRGFLFAPVRFRHYGVYGRGYRYTPNYVINPAGLLISLFIRPSYRHYYFGNYYGPQYLGWGIQPWRASSFHGHRSYDPLYSFYDSYYRRNGVDFTKRIDGWHHYFEEQPDHRFPRTLREMDHVATINREHGREAPIRLANSLNDLSRSHDNNGWTFRHLTDDQRNVARVSTSDVRNLAQQRAQKERPGIDAFDRDGPRSPILSRDRSGNERSTILNRDEPAARIARGNDGPAQPNQLRRERGDNQLQLPNSVHDNSAEGSPKQRVISSQVPRRPDSQTPSIPALRDRQSPGGLSDRHQFSNRPESSRDRPLLNRSQETPAVSPRISTPNRKEESRPTIRQTPHTGSESFRGNSESLRGRSESFRGNIAPRSIAPRSSNGIGGRSGNSQQGSSRIQKPQTHGNLPNISSRSRGNISSSGGFSNRGSQRSSGPSMNHGGSVFRSQGNTSRSFSRGGGNNGHSGGGGHGRSGGGGDHGRGRH